MFARDHSYAGLQGVGQLKYTHLLREEARVCLCGPLDHARVKQEVAHFDRAYPEVLQWMYVVCDSVLLCVWAVEVYRMWDFQYSRMRIWIIYFIILGLWKWVSATDDGKNQKIVQLLNEWMNENAINEWNIKIWCLTQWNYIKKKNLLKQNYLFHTNLQFQKFIKTSPSVLPGCGTRTKLMCTQPTSFPNHHTVVGETLHNTQ